MDVNAAAPAGSLTGNLFPSATDLLEASVEQPTSLEGPAVAAAPTSAPAGNPDSASIASPAATNTSGKTGPPTSPSTPPLQQAATKFFAPAGIQVSVSYQIVHNHQEIVTVFKDAATGKVVNQVPPEILLRLAAFFDQMAGGLVDSNA